MEVGRSKGKLLGGTEKVPWSKRKSLCPRESLHVEPSDFQSNKPNYRSTDQLPVGLTDFHCNQPTFCLTEQVSLGLSDFLLDQETFSSTEQLPIQQTNLQLDLTTSNPTARLLVQWEVGPTSNWFDEKIQKTACG